MNDAVGKRRKTWDELTRRAAKNVQDVLELKQQGLSNPQIAEKLEFNESTVIAILRRHG